MEIIPVILTTIFTTILAFKYFFTKIRFGINPLLIGKNKKTLYVKILETTPIILTTAVIFLSINNFLQDSLQESNILSYIGLIIGFFSFYFLILGYYNMGTSWRIGLSNTTYTPLITTGIFSLTRNPVYIAFYLFYFSLFLTSSKLMFLIFFLAILINLHLLILEEEKTLERIHGKEYLKYKKEIPRYF
jgi:protein-S-isoprenylcysteine O-methyltransferase Ste14